MRRSPAAAASRSASEARSREEAETISECPACGARLETPLGCLACGVLLRPATVPTPFEVFGLDPSWRVDRSELKGRLRRLGRLTHPDHHGTSPAEIRALAEANAATMNGAYEVLLDDFLRADWLVGHRGGPSTEDERQMPQEFLMDVLEWNEALDDAEGAAEGSPERARLDELARSLLTLHDERLAELGARLEPLPPQGSPVLAEIRRELNAIRYLSRALLRIRDLRFGSSSN